MRNSLRRLAILATMVAVLLACVIASIVGGQLAADAASGDQVTQYMVLLSGWGFVLAWAATFVVGWLIMRRRAAGGDE